MMFFGHKVTALERNPILAALLSNAFSRAEKDDKLGKIFKDQMNFVHCSVSQFLEQNEVGEKVIYFDPMFATHSGKKALSSKQMQFVSLCAGEDLDFEVVLEGLLRSAAKYVIVKRPDKSPELKQKPFEVIKGKTVQYEKYACRSRAF